MSWRIQVSKSESKLDDVAQPFSFSHHASIDFRKLHRHLFGALVADPFLVVDHSRLYIFFETTAYSSGIGRICCLDITDHGNYYAEDAINVVAEDFHLAYPCICCVNGIFYMTPHCSNREGVRIYRAKSFPFNWRYLCTLNTVPLTDPTSFASENFIYIYGVDSQGNIRSYRFDSISYAQEEVALKSSLHRWHNRPAGSPLLFQSGLYRPSQVMSKTYGHSVYLTKLTIDNLNLTEDNIHVPASRILSIGSSSNSHHISSAFFRDHRYIAIDYKMTPSSKMKILVRALNAIRHRIHCINTLQKQLFANQHGRES